MSDTPLEVPIPDRATAGRALAGLLAGQGGPNTFVLALPRGGVPVAFEIAEALDSPLDLLLVRKLGAPGQGELAMGAIATGGVRVPMKISCAPSVSAKWRSMRWSAAKQKNWRGASEPIEGIELCSTSGTNE